MCRFPCYCIIYGLIPSMMVLWWQNDTNRTCGICNSPISFFFWRYFTKELYISYLPYMVWELQNHEECACKYSFVQNVRGAKFLLNVPCFPYCVQSGPDNLSLVYVTVHQPTMSWDIQIRCSSGMWDKRVTTMIVVLRQGHINASLTTWEK